MREYRPAPVRAQRSVVRQPSGAFAGNHASTPAIQTGHPPAEPFPFSSWEKAGRAGISPAFPRVPGADKNKIPRLFRYPVTRWGGFQVYYA